MKIKRPTVYEMHELRMWISTIILPAAALVLYCDPKARDKVLEVKDALANKFKMR